MASEIVMRYALLISESWHQERHRSMSLATTQKGSKTLSSQSCPGNQELVCQKMC